MFVRGDIGNGGGVFDVDLVEYRINLILVSNVICLLCNDVVKEKRDEEDVELIVYIRWKNCVLSCSRICFENIGVVELSVIGIVILGVG